MPAYVVVEIKLPVDAQSAGAAALARYRQCAAASIARHDGRVRAMGPTAEAVLDQWPADTVCALIAFPTAECLQAWHASPDYAEARRLAQAQAGHPLEISHAF